MCLDEGGEDVSFGEVAGVGWVFVGVGGLVWVVLFADHLGCLSFRAGQVSWSSRGFLQGRQGVRGGVVLLPREKQLWWGDVYDRLCGGLGLSARYVVRA